MKIKLTVREIMDRGLWDDVCTMKGFSEWCVAEGQMDSSEEVEFTEEEAKQLGVVK